MTTITPSLAYYALIAGSIVLIIALGSLTYFLWRRSLLALVRQRYMSEPLGNLLQGIGRWLIIVLVLLLSLQQAGVQMASIWATLITLSAMVAVGFIAVWSVLSNMLCSVLLILFAPFRIGDEVEIIEATGGTGLRGKIINLNVLYTSLQEITDDGLRDTLLHVPNNIYLQKTIRHRRGTDTRSLDSFFLHRSARDLTAPEQL
jgi:small-conductance mechanosensitive channel